MSEWLRAESIAHYSSTRALVPGLGIIAASIEVRIDSVHNLELTLDPDSAHGG